MDISKSSPAEVAQLRAEMRRRKILERGDERMRKLFGESKDETQLSRSASVEERNKNLIDTIKNDPKVIERINSIDSNENDKERNLTASIATNNLATTDKSNDLNNELITNDLKLEEDSKKPKIDLSYFDKLEKKQRLKQERLEISSLQLFLISLINILTLKKDAIIVNLIKFSIACLSSYFCFNILTPFILSQSIAFLYTDFLLFNELNREFSFKLSYKFAKTNLLDSLSFLFIYIIVQTFVLD